MARHGCEKRDLILTKVTHASLSLQVNHKTWPKTRTDERAIAVKLCDRAFNMETSLANRSHQLKRYVEEYKDFKSHLEFYGKHTEVMKRLWAHLDSLYEECVALLATNPSIPSKP